MPVKKKLTAAKTKVVKKVVKKPPSKTTVKKRIVKTKSKSVTIDLTSKLEISQSEELKTELLNAFKVANQITLNGMDVDAVDTTGVQLLIAGFLKAKEENITMEWSHVSDSISYVADLMGISDVLKMP